MSTLDQRYFFSDGVRFACQQCGSCCTGEPGRIGISDEEMRLLLEGAGLEWDELSQHHLFRKEEGTWGIAEKPNGECVFYDGGCTIYPFRPRQCRTWPFWTKTMRSEASWEKTRQACPGIGKGPYFSAGQILDLLSNPSDCAF